MGSIVDVEARAQVFQREFGGRCQIVDVRLEELNSAPAVEAFFEKVCGPWNL
jgi:hypothetical protein